MKAVCSETLNIVYCMMWLIILEGMNLTPLQELHLLHCLSVSWLFLRVFITLYRSEFWWLTGRRRNMMDSYNTLYNLHTLNLPSHRMWKLNNSSCSTYPILWSPRLTVSLGLAAVLLKYVLKMNRRMLLLILWKCDNGVDGDNYLYEQLIGGKLVCFVLCNSIPNSNSCTP